MQAFSKITSYSYTDGEYKAKYDMSGVTYAGTVATYDGQAHSIVAENLPAGVTASYEGNDMVDRIFDSKPVRVLTGALGWTLGCKAVVMAATIFGPWGLLFGAFAAVGAYNSMKEDRNNYSSNNRNNGSNGNYRNNSGNGSNGGNKGKNGSQGKNNKNKWN